MSQFISSHLFVLLIEEDTQVLHDGNLVVSLQNLTPLDTLESSKPLWSMAPLQKLLGCPYLKHLEGLRRPSFQGFVL